MSRCVGIDLGTSNSVVATMINGRPVVIPDENGATTQASVISFMDDGAILVGNEARQRRAIDPTNTVYSAKRLIGRAYFSNEVRVAESHYPYSVTRGEDDNPKIIAQGQPYTPEEISALVLQRMKQIAESYLGERIEQAIITVPANFNEAQRTATKLAGELAGLEVLRILNEPTAAALAYGFGHERHERVAIYDFGGGTFDITLLELRGAVFEVLATAGNTYLGGDDFDNRLADYMIAAFNRKFEVDLSQDIRAVERLKNIAERVKLDLSDADKTAVRIEEYVPGHEQALEFSFSISRDGFAQRCGDIVSQTFVVCDDALRLGGFSSAEVDHVVLVGGTTRMPLVQQMVADYFFKEPVADVNPDEVVAVGAAIYASSLEEQVYAAAHTRRTDRALLIDVTPQALGISTAGGFTDVIIGRNENIPTERTRIFTTSHDEQEVVTLEIVEGDSRRTEKNTVLGKLQLSGIRPAPRGEVEIEVVFEVDTDGILNVSAIDKLTRNVQTAQLYIDGNLSNNEVERLKQSELPAAFDADDGPAPELMP